MKVLITGAASGIGKGCAELFLKENHEVYGFDKNISSIQHPKYTHFCLDIRDKNSYPEIGPVDILINNAGVQNGDDIDVNLKGTISVTEHYGIHPNIYSDIMIGSASGHTGSELPEYAARNTSETMDGCGRRCRVDLLYGGKKPFLYRPEHSH